MARWVGIYLEETPWQLQRLAACLERADLEGLLAIVHDLKPTKPLNLRRVSRLRGPCALHRWPTSQGLRTPGLIAFSFRACLPVAGLLTNEPASQPSHQPPPPQTPRFAPNRPQTSTTRPISLSGYRRPWADQQTTKPVEPYAARLELTWLKGPSPAARMARTRKWWTSPGCRWRTSVRMRVQLAMRYQPASWSGSLWFTYTS